MVRLTMKHRIGNPLAAGERGRRTQGMWLAVGIAASCAVILIGALVGTRPGRTVAHRALELQAAQRLIEANTLEEPYSRPDLAPYYEIIRSLSSLQVRELVRTGKLPVGSLTTSQLHLWVQALGRISWDLRQARGYREPLEIRYYAPDPARGRKKPAIAFLHKPYDGGAPRGWEMGLRVP
jgi:hypothetical protein